MPLHILMLKHCRYTFVVILPVITILFFECGAVGSIPAIEAATLPQGVSPGTAGAMAPAARGTPLHGAVAPVPSRHAQAGAVLALAVFATAGITQLHGARVAAPSRVTLTRISHAETVLATVKITYFWKQKCNTQFCNLTRLPLCTI